MPRGKGLRGASSKDPLESPAATAGAPRKSRRERWWNTGAYAAALLAGRRRSTGPPPEIITK